MHGLERMLMITTDMWHSFTTYRGKGHLKYLVGILMVCGGLVVTTLDCGLKGPRFQYHQQQRFVSLLGALSPASKI